MMFARIIAGPASERRLSCSPTAIEWPDSETSEQPTEILAFGRATNLRSAGSWRIAPLDFFHFRDRDDFEVDIVLEQGHSAVAGIEVKAAATVVEADLRGARKLRVASGKRFVASVILHDGSATVDFSDGLLAVPVRRLWETP